MTEQRFPYQALSGEYPTPGRPISLSPLQQYYTDGTTSRDTILLLPILESAHSDGAPSSCLQLTHLPNGDLGFCNRRADQQCT